jgi:hypothetical protein
MGGCDLCESWENSRIHIEGVMGGGALTVQEGEWGFVF